MSSAASQPSRQGSELDISYASSISGIESAPQQTQSISRGQAAEEEPSAGASVTPSSEHPLQSPEYTDGNRSSSLNRRGAGRERQSSSDSSSRRKRRLTDSAHRVTRVRTPSGRIRDQPLQDPWASEAGFSRSNAVDLTSDADFSAPRSRPPSSTRPVSNTLPVTLPRWQPDAEVSQCPICGRPFTFWFRKHHCRKCGRVVCATCSPHRITITRELIVHPPEANNRPWATALNQPVVVDLTDSPSAPRPAARTVVTGEEVRLCNPCVPDPQPNPQAALDLADFLRQGRRHDGDGSNSWMGRAPRPETGFVERTNHLRELRRQRGRGMIFQTENSHVAPIHTRADEAPEERLPDYGNFNYTLIPDPTRREHPPVYHPHAVNPPFPPPGYGTGRPPSNSDRLPITRGLPGIYRPQASSLSHHRYSSLDHVSRPPPTIRPRVRSMLDGDAALQQFEAASSSSAPARPAIPESDLCPICRHVLPAKGPNGDETAREAHVMDCIAARDPSSPRSPATFGRLSLPLFAPTPSRMLPFTASEKDCLGEQGGAQECSICFVEYNVGDEMARLECLCKFHHACIVRWFERKPECPVHKMNG